MSSRTYTQESTISKVTCNEIVLSLVVDKDLAEKWWYNTNKAFNMRKPIDVPTKEVYEYLVQFL
jgi:hypothetical protein